MNARSGVTTNQGLREKINEAKDAAKKEYDDRAENYKKALDEINKLNQSSTRRLSRTRKFHRQGSRR